MMTKMWGVAAVAAVAGAASGAIFFEVESNDTLGTANDLGSFGEPGDGIVVDGYLTSGDVDWFCFTLTDNATMVVAALFDMNPDQDNDAILGLFDSTGTELIVDDDEGIDLMPALQYANLAAGTYYLAVSGYPDFTFEGEHEESMMYKLVIGLNIPTPGALAALGLGGLAATRRRR